MAASATICPRRRLTARFTRFADRPSIRPLARPDREPMVALNTMLAEDGAIIDVPTAWMPGLIHLSASPPTARRTAAFHPRHTIRLAAGAKLTLMETALGDGTYLHNPVDRNAVADGASLTHIRLQDESPAAFHLATLYAEIAARGTYDSFTLNLGGRLARTEVHAAPRRRPTRPRI